MAISQHSGADHRNVFQHQQEFEQFGNSLFFQLNQSGLGLSHQNVIFIPSLLAIKGIHIIEHTYWTIGSGQGVPNYFS